MSDEEWTAADDAVEEVREVRRRLWERFDNDPRKYMDYIRELHDQLVREGCRETSGRGPADAGKSAA